MPQRGRSKKVAARQGQLAQRKKRQSPGPSGIPSSTGDLDVRNAGEVGEPQGTTPPGSPGTQPVEALRPSPMRRAEARPTVYNYVQSEIKRIAGLSAGILAILIVLTFVFR